MPLNRRRTRRGFRIFFRKTDLNYLVLAQLLLSLLPAQGKVRLCLDRTEWDFGQCQVNILLVTVGRGTFQVPLYWELLDNRSGNSEMVQLGWTV